MNKILLRFVFQAVTYRVVQSTMGSTILERMHIDSMGEESWTRLFSESDIITGNRMEFFLYAIKEAYKRSAQYADSL